jgi:hypothetical protein
MQQLSKEWFAARCGIPSGSQFKKIVTTEGKPSAQRFGYMYQLAEERIFLCRKETYQSQDMLNGTETEPLARSIYEMDNEVEVSLTGFQLHPCGLYGSSPDGLIGDDGLLEIKCPIASTHIGYLAKGKVPSEYFQQVQGHILCSGREWCDFYSYHSGLPELQVRAYPDEVFQKKLHDELIRFCAELDELVEKIRGKA